MDGIQVGSGGKTRSRSHYLTGSQVPANTGMTGRQESRYESNQLKCIKRYELIKTWPGQQFQSHKRKYAGRMAQWRNFSRNNTRFHAGSVWLFPLNLLGSDDIDLETGLTEWGA